MCIAVSLLTGVELRHRLNLLVVHTVMTVAVYDVRSADSHLSLVHKQKAANQPTTLQSCCLCISSYARTHLRCPHCHRSRGCTGEHTVPVAQASAASKHGACAAQSVSCLGWL